MAKKKYKSFDDLAKDLGNNPSQKNYDMFNTENYYIRLYKYNLKDAKKGYPLNDKYWLFYLQDKINRKSKLIAKRFDIKKRNEDLKNFTLDYPEEFITDLANRHKSSVKNFWEYVSSFELKTSWRLNIGLGTASLYETGITLHHIYGIPYIPASAVKGVVRSYIIQEVFGDDLKIAEGKAIEDKNFCDIFGCPAEIKIENQKFESYYTKKEGKKKGDRIGKIIFFDAFPVEQPKIEPDVMNVHYPDYYNDTKNRVAPTDYQNPNPIPFLTVKNTKFQFVIGSKERLDNNNDFVIGGKSIEAWLKQALTNHGIGAKTAVGYGRFKEEK